MSQQKNALQIRAEYYIALVLMWTLRCLPLAMANAVASMTTRILDAAVPRLRRIALTNLSFAFPELNKKEHSQIVDGVFRSIARLLLALARFPSLNSSNISKWIAYEGLENYREAKALARGVLVATAHLGNWELSAFAHAILTEPMHVMVRPLDNPLIEGLVERRRTQSGNHLICKRDAARAVIKALRSNDAVGILADQNTAASEGVFVPFFGKLACAGSGLVKLAYRSQAAVVPGFAVWEETHRRYILRFYPRVELSGDAATDTQRIHSIFENIIRQYPDQWMWIHRRWKTRPPGEEPLY